MSPIVGVVVVLLGAQVAEVSLEAQDRRVAWVRAGDADFERDLNAHAGKGLRLAAISDGLPCAVAVLQAPERALPPIAYRVVREGDLGEALPRLAAEGFVPVGAARTFGTRHQVVFARSGPAATPSDWRLLEFEKLEDLEGALAGASAEGFRLRLFVRPPFRSWPGLSERGLVLVERREGAAARAARVLIGTKRDLKDVIDPVAAATREGWAVDAVASSARDGGRDGRRERLIVAMSRGDAPPADRPPPVTIERSLFGMIGGGVPVGAASFWDAYAFAWTPAARRQIWASPVRLSEREAQCAGLEWTLSWRSGRDERSTVVALVGRPVTTGGFELVVVTEDRLGGS